MSHFTGNERIYYQNGMNNNLDDALAGRALLNTFFPNENVGLIHNKTGGLMDDVAEYLPNGLAKKDVVLAHMYTKLSEKSGDNLVVTFSAGNEDIKKAMRVMALDGRSANHKISVISAGSPVGLKALQKVAEPVGITIRSQHNTLKDPITWGPAGMIGAAAVASVPVGVYTAAKVFPLALATGPYAIPIAGAQAFIAASIVASGSTFGTQALGIHRYHSFDKYLDRNDGGFRDEIMQWGVDNGLEVYLPASYHESKQPLFRTPDKVGSWKNALGRVSTL